MDRPCFILVIRDLASDFRLNMFRGSVNAEHRVIQPVHLDGKSICNSGKSYEREKGVLPNVRKGTAHKNIRTTKLASLTFTTYRIRCAPSDTSECARTALVVEDDQRCVQHEKFQAGTTNSTGTAKWCTLIRPRPSGINPPQLLALLPLNEARSRTESWKEGPPIIVLGLGRGMRDAGQGSHRSR